LFKVASQNDLRAWTVRDSVELYNVNGWGRDFFTINDAGNIEVTPGGPGSPKIDLKELVDDLRSRGLKLPLLIRFSDILKTRIQQLAGSFQQAIVENEYKGAYRGVYPIKVNQDRYLVERLVQYGRPYHYGLEAGSKPELMAVMAMLEDEDALIICNDFNRDGQPDAIGAPAVQTGKQVSECVSNDRLAQVPRFALNAQGELRLPLGSVTPFVRGLVNYRPGFYSSNDDYQYRAYTKVDLFVGVRDDEGRWELTAFAKNLLNQTRALSVSQGNFQQGTAELDFTFSPTGRAGIPFDSGYRTANISPPREFGLTAKFNW